MCDGGDGGRARLFRFRGIGLRRPPVGRFRRVPPRSSNATRAVRLLLCFPPRQSDCFWRPLRCVCVEHYRAPRRFHVGFLKGPKLIKRPFGLRGGHARFGPCLSRRRQWRNDVKDDGNFDPLHFNSRPRPLAPLGEVRLRRRFFRLEEDSRGWGRKRRISRGIHRDFVFRQHGFHPRTVYGDAAVWLRCGGVRRRPHLGVWWR
mmetsp:Transcript_3296/g.9979  ORF Transcript_3296/g.9979 Transcript_3296/m.9979 type:complete len:203 (+) Transcript_3296:369-977(+)